MFRFVYDMFFLTSFSLQSKLNHAPIEAHCFHRVMNINEVYVRDPHSFLAEWRLCFELYGEVLFSKILLKLEIFWTGSLCA